MDALSLVSRANDCLLGQSPPCACACPLELDVRGMVERVREGKYPQAYKLFAGAAVFPEIVCRVCDRPCEVSCVRREVDASISLLDLERAVCRYGFRETTAFYIPPKNKTVLVVGGSLGALACGVKLSRRGYRVELHEQGGRLGGALWDLEPSLLPRDILEREMDRVTTMEFLTVHLNSVTDSLDHGQYDAVLVATGEAIPPAGGVFFTGDMEREGFTQAVAKGVRLSYEIESYLKVGKAGIVSEQGTGCAFAPDTGRIAPAPPVAPADKDNWTKEEAVAEAERCLLCECRNCLDRCDMLRYFGKIPKKVLVDINDTVNKTEVNQKLGLRQIASCTQCGLCSTFCPTGIDIRDIILESRREMHRSGSLPPAYYQFWIEDMRHGCGDEAAVALAPPDNDAPRYAFFPGCQMAASDPEYVARAYRWLLDAHPGDVGLLLYCCGAPAHWAGREEVHGELLDALRTKWEAMGRPQLITACPTCADMLARYLPEATAATLWERMAGEALPSRSQGGAVSVFDPCTSKHHPHIQQSVRGLAEQMGFALEPLPSDGEEARCCGYGGLIYGVNPKLHQQMGERNAALGEADYITYCVNCRDSFAAAGKPAYHILDLLFWEGRERRLRQPPSLTRRRQNRVAAKTLLLERFWGIDHTPRPQPWDQVELDIPAQVREKMDRSLILEEHVKRAVHHGETTGAKLRGNDGNYICHLLEGILTYWVEYTPLPQGFQVHNVYMHRMTIDEKGGG